MWRAALPYSYISRNDELFLLSLYKVEYLSSNPTEKLPINFISLPFLHFLSSC